MSALPGNFEIQQVNHPLTFQFVDEMDPVKIVGTSTGGMQCYDVEVKYHHGNRRVGMYIHAPSLEIAIRMIEAYGQQFKVMTDGDFTKFHTAHAGKTTFFHALNKQDGGAERIIFYHPDKFHKTLEHAFTPAVSNTVPKMIVLDAGSLDEVRLRAEDVKRKKIQRRRNVQGPNGNGVQLQVNNNNPPPPP